MMRFASAVLDLQDVYPISGGGSRQDGRRPWCGAEHLGSRGNHYGISDGKETYVNGIVVAPSGSSTSLPGRWRLLAGTGVETAGGPVAGRDSRDQPRRR